MVGFLPQTIEGTRQWVGKLTKIQQLNVHDVARLTTRTSVLPRTPSVTNATATAILANFVSPRQWQQFQRRHLLMINLRPRGIASPYLMVGHINFHNTRIVSLYWFICTFINSCCLKVHALAT